MVQSGLCLVGLRDVLGSSFLDLQSQVFSELHDSHPCTCLIFFFAKGEEKSQSTRKVSRRMSHQNQQPSRKTCVTRVPRSLQQSCALDHHNLAWYGLQGETARKHERWRKPESCSTSKSMRVSRWHGVWEVPDEPSPGRVDGGKLVPLWTTYLPLHWRERPVELFREPQRALDKLALSCAELVATQRRLPVRNDCGGSRPF